MNSTISSQDYRQIGGIRNGLVLGGSAAGKDLRPAADGIEKKDGRR